MEREWPANGRKASDLHPDPDPKIAFSEMGVCSLGRFLDDAALAAVRAAVDEIAPAHGVVGPYACIVHDAWRRSDVLGALVPHFGALVCAAVGIPELVLFHDHILVKPPGGTDMAWHQDFSYLPIDRSGGLTLWIALDDATEDNGCLYYVFGSHLDGEFRPAWGLTGEHDERARLPLIDIPAEERGIPVPTPAGWALVHHELALHRSPSNRTQRPRRSWVLSFVASDARWAPQRAPHPRSAVSPRHHGQALEDELPRVRASDRGARERAIT